MQRKDVLELRKRFTKGHSTFSNMTGCYVNGEKKIISKFSEFFPSLEEDEMFKYLEIAKKTLSGNIGNNVLKLDFPLDDNFTNTRQSFLMDLKKSGLKDNELLDEFYKLVIDTYDYDGNFLILLFHDTYDIMTKTKDNQSLDDSIEVFEYILCAICPVSLSDAALTYVEEEDKIKSRIRDWVVDPPSNGFVFPAFVDRSSDVNSAIYYTRKPKDPHPELMEGVLACKAKYTSTLEKEAFKSIVQGSLELDEEEANIVFMDVQDNLNNMVEEYNTLYDDIDYEPIRLSDDNVREVLEESGVPKEASSKIENTYLEVFKDEQPLAESLLDKKVLKESQQLQKERNLIKQLNVLENKLEEISPDNIDNKIVLNLSSEKASSIERKTINGQEYILVPVNKEDKTIINGKTN